jgi:tRNA wybutosine-synthesizing protein 1
VEDLADFLFDTLLKAPQRGAAARPSVVVVLLSTHTDGEAPPRCAHFLQLLEDHALDFRVGQAAMAHLHFAVAGFGSDEYEPTGHFCTAASRTDVALASMGALRLLPLVRITDTLELSAQVEPWCSQLKSLLCGLADGTAVSLASRETAAAAAHRPLTSGALDEDSGSESDSSGTSTTVGSGSKANVAEDVEDMDQGCAGDVMASRKTAAEPKEMLTTKHRAQLTKEGYKIIGSHSAVKLCRWTKHQLRGQGGCYKHSFYGITSYQCMEATPSLACANKCTFCWRHHKNPVATEWKWRMDDPEEIVAEGIELHQKMIKECKGIPGVKKDRFDDAMTVRHCALSLVGEPIMYPRINELLTDLHRRHISTFLVTNGQFPEAIQNLCPVTQLYVSIDAATPEALKAVDRPLHRDFWERYLDSLRALADKKQRTVYRLTLVKGENMSDAGEYARLFALGKPDLVEIKSVTFCGTSKASTLTMSNTPWHVEVKEFAESILSHEGLGEEYELACEHQHSCIVLLAHRKFKINGQWHTWIDYDRYDELVNSGKDFGAMDYLAPTPSWALYGSEEAGFDPEEKRKYHNRTRRRAMEGALSEAQISHYPKDFAALHS